MKAIQIFESASPYPIHHGPFTNADLKRLYDQFNHDYFGGVLPKCDVKFAPLAKNYLGKAHGVFNGTRYTKLVVTIATMIQTSVRDVTDTLLHEMIHVWQYHMHETTKDRDYLDDSFLDSIVFRDKHERNHRKHFQSWMNKLNALGFNITIAGDAPVDVDLVKPAYAVVFDQGSETSIVLWSFEDPTEHMDKVIESTTDRAGAGFFNSYQIVKTTDSLVMQFVRLTKAFVLPRNVLRIQTPRKYVDLLLNSSLTAVTKVSKPEEAEKAVNGDNVPAEITALLPLTAKFRHVSFTRYLYNVLANTKAYSRMAPDYRYEYPAPLDGVPKEAVDAIYQHWLNVSPKEARQNHDVKSAASWVIMDWDKPARVAERVKMLETEYHDSFAARMKRADYYRVCVDAAITEYKAKVKKYSFYVGRVGNLEAFTGAIEQIYEPLKN